MFTRLIFAAWPSGIKHVRKKLCVKWRSTNTSWYISVHQT